MLIVEVRKERVEVFGKDCSIVNRLLPDCEVTVLRWMK